MNLPNEFSTRGGYTSKLTIDRFASLLLTLIVDVALLLSLAEVTRVRAAPMSTLLGRIVCESFLTGAALTPTFS